METRIKELCEASSIKSAYELAKLSNNRLKMPTAYRAFADNIKHFTPETLEILCDVLRCSPSDIFIYESKRDKPANQPGMVNNAASGSDLLTTIKVAERLGLSRKRVNDYVTLGELRSVKGKGNHNFISEADLQAFIDNRKGN
jgi:excisionase family DNA binding protein